jgi:hypothetical protein
VNEERTIETALRLDFGGTHVSHPKTKNDKNTGSKNKKKRLLFA